MTDSKPECSDFLGRLDATPRQRKPAYVRLMDQTGIAVGIDRGEYGMAWFTGYDGVLYATSDENDEAEPSSVKQFERWLGQYDAGIVDRMDIYEFQELVG